MENYNNRTTAPSIPASRRLVLLLALLTLLLTTGFAVLGGIKPAFSCPPQQSGFSVVPSDPRDYPVPEDQNGLSPEDLTRHFGQRVISEFGYSASIKQAVFSLLATLSLAALAAAVTAAQAGKADLLPVQLSIAFYFLTAIMCVMGLWAYGSGMQHDADLWQNMFSNQRREALSAEASSCGFEHSNRLYWLSITTFISGGVSLLASLSASLSPSKPGSPENT